MTPRARRLAAPMIVLALLCAIVTRADAGKAGGGASSAAAPAGTVQQAKASRASAGDERAQLAADTRRLRDQLASLQPKDPYIVVDTHKNMIFYRQGEETIHEALCSTGCDSILKAPDGRQWSFATPKGVFKIKGKIKNPTWVKPDWAFIEEGLPVPSRTHPDRYDNTAMGSYALDFGDGYYIHGTLYRRLLGESITHGCVRVADEDLRPIFEKAKIGTAVYVF